MMYPNMAVRGVLYTYVCVPLYMVSLFIAFSDVLVTVANTDIPTF